MTDVCLKRKVRNFVQLSQSEGAGEDLKAKKGTRSTSRSGASSPSSSAGATNAKATARSRTASPATVKEARAWMCRTFYDVRAFGAVMSTGKAGDEDGDDKSKKSKDKEKKSPGTQKLWNCGQVRGPIQLSFARSINPILTLEHAITRVALTNPGDTKRGADVGEDASEATSGQMGRKSTVPYALYRAHGFVSPFLARDTGFTRTDLDLFWQALAGMFEHDRSASRGVMAARALIVFEHASARGNHPSHLLFREPGHAARRAQDKGSKAPPRPRSFDHYAVERRPVEAGRRRDDPREDLSRVAERDGGSVSHARAFPHPRANYRQRKVPMEVDDLLPLSGLQHLIFCERQFALIHVEQLWAENELTISGRQLHERADLPGEAFGADVRVARALPLRSDRLGLAGKADVVEFHRESAPDGVIVWRPFPVEYKRGRPKAGGADEVQLCAQAICLEEMLGLEVPGGALFYGKTRRRKAVEFTTSKTSVQSASRRPRGSCHEQCSRASTHAPRRARDKGCDRCSLFLTICLPGVTGEASPRSRVRSGRSGEAWTP